MPICGAEIRKESVIDLWGHPIAEAMSVFLDALSLRADAIPLFLDTVIIIPLG